MHISLQSTVTGSNGSNLRHLIVNISLYEEKGPKYKTPADDITKDENPSEVRETKRVQTPC